MVEGETCNLLNSTGVGVSYRAEVPFSDSDTGDLHYKAMVSTLGGTSMISYPGNGEYLELTVTYRAPFGSAFGSIVLFMTVVGFVWGGLGVCLRMMASSGKVDEILEADLDVEVF